MKTRYNDITPFVTRDGSLIRELLHPQQHGNKNQSLAEAVIAVGCETVLHRHHTAEELYYIVQGQGEMTLGNETFPVVVGDTVAIAPGTAHKIRNTGKEELKILCCCAPAYAHADTELLE
jgi:mannose-6-phosphate isomerase-like protein (cupin superfamily)